MIFSIRLSIQNYVVKLTKGSEAYGKSYNKDSFLKIIRKLCHSNIYFSHFNKCFKYF
ncbi:hypothetical protein BN1326_30064 [Staphylococcus argenteus]|uniref:Uncharacterized protein n=1 Tax=Staphylococcus argenteus TaxID=985002 RepID=A0A7U7PX26_9STAP|nr:hypothetical protein BN1326_30064 [Staphylococcus argenteus]CRI20322.1 hypothetical protein BN1326_30064 [Staphylococcus argenteus]